MNVSVFVCGLVFLTSSAWAQKQEAGPSSAALDLAVAKAHAGHFKGTQLGLSNNTQITNNANAQNETSIAVDPSNPMVVIAGFNDYRLGTGFGGQGVAVSADGGSTWTDLGTAIPQPAGFGRSGGDPGIAFNSNGRAFYNHIAAGFGMTMFTRSNGVFVASSINGGTTWAASVAVASNTWPGMGTVPFEDKPFIAADEFPGSLFRDRVYMSWTRFYDVTHPNDGAVGGGDILFSRSTDNGVTWSAPLSLTTAALQPANGGTGTAGSSFVQGSEPEVAANGDVYVVYFFGGRVDVSRSTNGGMTFGAPTQPFGTMFGTNSVSCPLPNESFRVNSFPNIETDPTRPGSVYVVSVVDPDGVGNGSDGGDIVFTRSTNNGATWGAMVTLNDDGVGNNQIFPWMAVDPVTGNICVIWYDTRLDVGNHDLDVFGTFSFDGGLTFSSNIRVTTASFDPDTGQFNQGTPGCALGTNFIGDYNGIGAGGNVFHALWTDGRTGEEEIFYESKDAGGPLDIFVVVDLSGSFIDDLATFKVEAADIIDSLTASNADTKFGLAKFEDYPISPFGLSTDTAYERLLNLTFDENQVLTTIAGLSIASGSVGGDSPQSQLPALFQAASGAGQVVPGFPDADIAPGQQASFRNNAVKLFLLWTDASFHLPGDPGDIPYPGPSFDETVMAIAALDPPKVLGISSGGGGMADLAAIALATGAVAPEGGVDCDGDGMVDILEGEPLVCPTGATGEGIASAIIAVVEAVPRPPICDAGGPYVVECQGGTTRLTVRGTGSFDPDGEPLGYLWSSDCPGSFFDDPMSSTPELSIATSSGIGLACNLMLTVTVDGRPEETSSCETSITVVDTTSPLITTIGEPIVLWPPNHKYVTIEVAACVLDAFDVCDSGVTRSSVEIMQVSSDEPDIGVGASGGDGNKAIDIIISPDKRSVQLRSERSGTGNGRVYTITFRVSDSSGNEGIATCRVDVPHDQDGEAVDDGPAYVVSAG